MMVPAALLLLGVLTALVAPRLLARARWPEREPVVALWLWQCVVGAVLLSFALSMVLSAAAAWEAVRGRLFATAPHGVVEAYALGPGGAWATVTALGLAAAGVWSGAMLVREVARARRRLRLRHAELRERAPLLPGEEPGGERLVVLEAPRAGAWWLSGPAPQLVVTTAALRRLKGRQLDAVFAHEQGHAAARHDWLLHCAEALAGGFPQVPVFEAFREEMHRLVELAADDAASRRYGRLTIALALVGLNEDRGTFGPCAHPQAHVPERVRRLLSAPARLPARRRLLLTAAALLVPAVPVAVALVPGLSALS
ncbi:M48 family metalloprotease [Streptomyces sp. NPDC097619]|uniref:M56 family metallopeptidase n=1 Tax=Streptomyces sp. NPDC097619 TaxID=3157228 RepID=UPI003317C69A